MSTPPTPPKKKTAPKKKASSKPKVASQPKAKKPPTPRSPAMPTLGHFQGMAEEFVREVLVPSIREIVITTESDPDMEVPRDIDDLTYWLRELSDVSASAIDLINLFEQAGLTLTTRIDIVEADTGQSLLASAPIHFPSPPPSQAFHNLRNLQFPEPPDENPLNEGEARFLRGGGPAPAGAGVQPTPPPPDPAPQAGPSIDLARVFPNSPLPNGVRGLKSSLGEAKQDPVVLPTHQ